MAVANFQYITRMSSGFKVYILEGQPHHRGEDRYRHMANERTRAPAVFPIKRKRGYEKGLTLEERRERAINRSKMAQRPGPMPAVFSNQQSPSSPQCPTPSPTSPLPAYVYYTPVSEEPLALIKKPRKEPENAEEKISGSAGSKIQMRPSVITCVPSVKNPSSRPEVRKSHSSDSNCNYDHVLEEHFQRSLGANYQQARAKELSISVSVDDHFAKALGEDKWLQLQSKSSSCSSTPPSSPSITLSPTYSQSPNQSHRESSLTSSHWSVN
ncbi:vestigial like 4 like [Cyprinodon tularosa]|uniref:Vestigial like 4 like n=1 Tax=Cyprinodon variegatus TaxID=28743 RepID=A0A3Q2D0P8_CYPVA|nr:PREDICTED: transcription cofactor vestigial-like protein 4 [Cyprinodon variegatus]XP_038139343.1 vestigial like 4 like [Cyprinodon tularosa]